MSNITKIISTYLLFFFLSSHVNSSEFGYGLKLGAMSGPETVQLTSTRSIQGGGDKIFIPSLRIKRNENDYINIGVSTTGSISEAGGTSIEFSTIWLEGTYERVFQKLAFFGGATYGFFTDIKIENSQNLPVFKYKNSIGLVLGSAFSLTNRFRVGVRVRYVEYENDGLPALRDVNGDLLSSISGSSYGMYLEYASN